MLRLGSSWIEWRLSTPQRSAAMSKTTITTTIKTSPAIFMCLLVAMPVTDDVSMNGYMSYSIASGVTCQALYNGYMPQSSAPILEPDQAEELFIAFANTLEYERGQPVDSLPDVEALLAWLRERRLLSGRGLAAEAARLRRDGEEAARRVERFRQLRDVLHAIAADVNDSGHPTTAELRDLNHILRDGLHYHQIEMDPDSTRYTFAQVGDRLDQARATIASSLAQLLAEDSPSRLRVCANPGCRFLFIDRSPTGRRRWCDMRTCGNQAKVARHRARARVHLDEAPLTPVRGVPPATASV
jgi:predicted RNA-binding Zn ribbon-like protein